jgi:hypothetical protein
MTVGDFFDNLAVYFKDEDEDSTEGLVHIYRNEDGLVTEIRVFNTEYQEFLIITRDRRFEVISVADYIEKEKELPTKPKGKNPKRKKVDSK